MAISGTKEWATANVNCINGCSHDCRYCYARENAIRFGQVKKGDWAKEIIREDAVKKSRRKVNGRIMFPTQHDIVPATLDACLIVLGKLLVVGNEVLVVSKPHLPCIKAICEKFSAHKNKLIFRFTIGATDDAILSFWEPGAPLFSERLGVLCRVQDLRQRRTAARAVERDEAV